MAQEFYNRTRRPYFFQHRDGRVVTVFNLRAFADSIGGNPKELHRIISTMEGQIPKRSRFSYKGWEYACEEEAGMLRDNGHPHQYVVYGQWQREEPNSKQLQARVERLPPRPKQGRGYKSFCLMSPDHLFHAVCGLSDFCEAFGFEQGAVSAVVNLRNKTFSAPGSRVEVNEQHLVKYHVDRQTRQQVPSVVTRRRSRGKPRWRLATYLEMVEAHRTGNFKSVIRGVDFTGRPPDFVLEAWDLKWEDIFPVAAMRGES